MKHDPHRWTMALVLMPVFAVAVAALAAWWLS